MNVQPSYHYPPPQVNVPPPATAVGQSQEGGRPTGPPASQPASAEAEATAGAQPGTGTGAPNFTVPPREGSTYRETNVPPLPNTKMFENDDKTDDKDKNKDKYQPIDSGNEKRGKSKKGSKSKKKDNGKKGSGKRSSDREDRRPVSAPVLPIAGNPSGDPNGDS